MSSFGVPENVRFLNLLHQCQEPSCRGLGRSIDLDPVCEGTQRFPHSEVTMLPVDDQGQQETPGLIVNGDEIGAGS